MRNKLREMKNREEGFTLVELLAVIVILGIIVAIAIPSIGGIINRAQSNADEAEQDLVVDAARLYVAAEYDTLTIGTGDAKLTVTASQLVDWGYLEDRGATTEGAGVSGSVDIERVEAGSDAAANEVDTFSYTFVPES